MNSLPPREDVENHAATKTCFYCKKVFNNYQALGGHLRIHQPNGLLKTGNFPGRLPNSSETSRMHPVAVPNGQQEFSSGLDGNHLTSFTRTTFPFGLPRIFCTNELNQADMSNFTGNNPRFARIPSILSQNFSYGSIADINYLYSCLSATASAPLPRMAFALSGGMPSSPLEVYQGHNSGPNLCFSISKGQGSVFTQDKRSFFGEGSANGGTTNVSKKQKNICGLPMESEESRKKELPLFVNVDDTISASEALGAETKGQVDVDLSLHL